MIFEGDQEYAFYIDDNWRYFIDTDSIPINFVKLDDSVQSLIYKVVVIRIGLPQATAQKYNIKINEEMTDLQLGKDFFLEGDMTLGANESIDTIVVKILRSSNLAVKMRKIVLELDSSSNFSAKYPLKRNRSITQRITFYPTDFIENPTAWDEFYLGKFSAKKLRLLVKLDNDWSFDVMYENVGDYSGYFGYLLYEYLLEQKEKGEPVLESDGTLMQWGEVYN